MSTISGAAEESRWPRVEVVAQAMGVLMVRDGTTLEEASASLDEMAGATGLEVGDVAAAVARSTGAADVDEAHQSPPVSAEPEVDVEVSVDDTWWPGYLFRRDWHETTQGRWVCFVRFNTWGSPEGRIENRARHFEEDHIRPAKTPTRRG